MLMLIIIVVVLLLSVRLVQLCIVSVAVFFFVALIVTSQFTLINVFIIIIIVVGLIFLFLNVCAVESIIFIASSEDVSFFLTSLIIQVAFNPATSLRTTSTFLHQRKRGRFWNSKGDQFEFLCFETLSEEQAI